MTRGMGRRSLALTAAATLTLGGLVLAAPAVAEEKPALPDATEAAPPQDVVDAAEGAQDAGVEIVAVGVNEAGEDIVVVTAASVDSPEGEDAVKSFAAEADIKDAKIVTVAAAPQAWDEGDVVGGQGYAGFGDDGYLYACSIGFSAFSPEGDPAYLSAGHCAFDQNGNPISATALTVPGGEPAVGGPGYEFENDEPFLLGEFAFAQFGGPNGTTGSDGDVNSTDVSVIDVVDGYTLLPAVTDWTSAGDSVYSAADSTKAVRSVGEPVRGEISKSGRTTGFTTGDITADHVTEGWAKIEDRWVRGFSSNVEAGPGDSGGSVIQGTKAIGLISGGVEGSATQEQWTWSTSLVHALEFTGGYEVALNLVTPKVADPASGSTVERGSTITGTAPGAEVVEISVDGGEPTEAKVSDGTFSFKVSNKGEHSFEFTSVNGFSRSGSTTWNVTVVPPTVAAPAITSPADGSQVVSGDVVISGTGIAGYTIRGDIGNGNSGSGFETVVAEDGTWKLDGADWGVGEYGISVQQFRNDEEFSATVSSKFTVIPAAPVITSIFNGQNFGATAGPTEISGTGTDGATVKLRLNGVDAAGAVSAQAALSGSFTATVVDGAWSIDFGGALEPGNYTVHAVQTVTGINSLGADLAFVVSPAQSGGNEGGNGGNEGGETPADPGTGGDDELATTGMDTLVPLTASAGAIALIGAGIVLLMARRRKLAQD